MIWAAKSFEGQEFVYFLEEKEYSDFYKDILKELISKVKKLYQGEMIFIQNNAPAHCATYVKEFLE